MILERNPLRLGGTRLKRGSDTSTPCVAGCLNQAFLFRIPLSGTAILDRVPFSFIAVEVSANVEPHFLLSSPIVGKPGQILPSRKRRRSQSRSPF